MPNISRSYTEPGSPVVSVTVSRAGIIIRKSGAANNGSGTIVRTGIVTPGYWKKRLTGELPENRFRFQETYISPSFGSELVVDANPFLPATTVSTGTLGWSFPFAEPFTGIDVTVFNQGNLVKAKIADKVKDVSVDLSVVAGELRETRRMFVEIASSLSRALGLARKGRFRDAARALGIRPEARSPANGWLLLNYGILPLISDLKGSIQALEKGLVKERYYLVSARDTYHDGVTQVSGEYTLRWELKSEVSARVKYRVVNSNAATLASLGLTNPLTTGWELTKLSFVVDWLVGVGSWLNQVDAYFGKSFASGSVTEYLQVTASGIRRAEGPVGDYGFRKHDSSRKYQRVSVKRDVMVSFPIAVLPGFKDPISAHHVATATSLLVQLRR